MLARCLLILLSFTTTVTLAQEKVPSDSAMQIVDEAIEAMGGQKKLAPLQGYEYHATGSLDISPAPFVVPNPIKMTRRAFQTEYLANFINSDEGAIPITAHTVLAKEKGWQTNGRRPEDFRGEGVRKRQIAAVLELVMRNPTLLKDAKKFSLAPGDETEIDGKPAKQIVAKLIGNDLSSITCYFEKGSHLPVMASMTQKNPDGKLMFLETYFRDYQEMDGVKVSMATELISSGKTVLSLKLKDFVFRTELKEESFAIPGVEEKTPK